MMIKEFKIPELGENIHSAEIVKINVFVGSEIKKDDILFEIETDKATIEVPSDFSGIIKEIKIKEGTKANIGEVAILIEESSSEEKKESKSEEKVQVSFEIKNDEKSVFGESKAEISKSNLIDFKMPELGENIHIATISKVLVKVGERITKDQILLEAETDKATIEIPSEIDGIIKEVKILDNGKAKVGETIFVIESEEVGNSAVVVKSEEKPKIETEKQEIVAQVAESEGRKSENKIVQTDILPNRIVPASPSVRRFAREIGIEIANVRGSGPGGRISVEDVKLFAKNLNQTLTQNVTSAGNQIVGIKQEILPDFSKFGEIETQAMNNIRKKTAEHLSFAWQTIPHVTQFEKADITELEEIRKKYAKIVEKEGGKLTMTSILLKVVATALKIFPQFNSSIDFNKKEIIFKKYFNIGIAVDTPKGLVVPVIKNVDRKSILELSVELSQISAKAKDGKLSLEDMQGGNFTISNLGGIGGTAFTPIVNSPEVAILGVSKSQIEPKFIENQFQPRLILPLSLSYDHRIIDGADGARFAKYISDVLENPFLLSL